MAKSLPFRLLGLAITAACIGCEESDKSAEIEANLGFGEGGVVTTDDETTEAEPVAVTKQASDGEDWPIFLGPRETGVSGETGYADKWPKDGPAVVWKKRVGTGYSAPSIRGDRLVLHHRPRGNEEIVECFDPNTGESKWRFTYETDYEDPYDYNNGPRCTPLLTEDRCYTYGPQGVLLCLDLKQGDEIWRRNCVADFSTEDYDIEDHWFFGIGCTPVLEGDLLIALVGGPNENAVAAFEKNTGKTVWTAVGKSTWDGRKTGRTDTDEYEWTGDEHTISYSSPIVATIHGKRHLLCLVRQGLVSLEPKTGTVNFAYFFRPRVHESVNAARPVVIGDRIFLSAAYKHGSAMLRVKPDGKGYEELWRDRRNMLNHWSTSIYADGRLYGFSGRHQNEGEFRCLDAKTGDVLWSIDGSDGLHEFLIRDIAARRFIDKRTNEPAPWPYLGRGSCIRVEDKFVVLGEHGTLCLARINPKKYEELARTSFEDIDYPAWTAPVLTKGRLYLRDEDTLLCLKLPRKE